MAVAVDVENEHRSVVCDGVCARLWLGDSYGVGVANAAGLGSCGEARNCEAGSLR